MFDHFNILSDNFPYIPPEAFLYQPTSKNPDIENQQIQTLQTDDYIIKTKDNQIKRLIFQGDTKYTKFQNQKLQQFDQYLARKGITIDARWNRSWKLRWLQSTNYDNKKTVQDMKKYVEYLDQHKEIHLSPNIEKYMKAGVYYLAGRDSKFRPILVLDVKKMINLNLPEEEIYQCEVYFFEFIIRNLLIPGHVEMWNTIIDVGYEGVMSMMSPMKSSISFLQSTFRSRMYVAYIVRPSGTCAFMWSIAQRFLQQDTKRKVVFVQNEVMTALLEYCHPSQLEKKFGGLLEIQENQCWPSRIFSNEFHSKTDRKMLTIPQYRQKYQRNELSHTKVYEPYAVPPPQIKVQQKHEVISEPKVQSQTSKKSEKKVIKQNISKADLIEVDCQISKCLQKLHEEDIAFLQQLNQQASSLSCEEGFDWLISNSDLKVV